MLLSAFERLVRTPPAQWVVSDLDQCSVQELSALAALFGFSTSGTRDVLLSRITVGRELRLLLSTIATPDQLVARYTRAALYTLCCQARLAAPKAGAYPHLNKYGVAASLLRWREETRRRGRDALAEARRAAQQCTTPRQLRLRCE